MKHMNRTGCLFLLVSGINSTLLVGTPVLAQDKTGEVDKTSEIDNIW